MLSRVADSLYWMSRYLERAEHAARLIDLNLNMTLELSPEAAARHWRRLLACLTVPLPENLPLRAFQLTQYLTFSAKHDALVSHVSAARENARQVREEISSDMWEQINRLYLQVRRVDIDHIWNSQPDEFFRAVREGAHLFHGITDSTLTHADGWHFIQLGRFIERAKLTASLLDVHFAADDDEEDEPVGRDDDFLRWVNLLKSCSAFEAYCQYYTADFRPERILEFLLLNPDFPRSVRFCSDVIVRALETIAKAVGGKQGRPERLAGRLLATLDYSVVEEIMADNLHSYLENIQRQCSLIHTATHQVYIAYPVESALAS